MKLRILLRIPAASSIVHQVHLLNVHIVAAWLSG